MASAAGTTPQPGWVSDAACESSVSSACAAMPLASAAPTALVTMRLPTTPDSRAPPSVRAKEIAFRPGSRRDPETIAAIVSSTWCLVFSSTGAGSGLRSAPAIWALNCRMTGETESRFTASDCRR